MYVFAAPSHFETHVDVRELTFHHKSADSFVRPASVPHAKIESYGLTMAEAAALSILLDAYHSKSSLQQARPAVVFEIARYLVKISSRI